MKTLEAIELFLRSRQAKNVATDTLRWYRGILLLFAQRFKRLPTKPEDIEAFLIDCQGGDERKHGYYRAIRALYNFLEKRRGLNNPIRYLEPPRRRKKQPRPLTPDEIDQLLSFPHIPRIKAALLFLTDTGCRVGEAAMVEPGDIITTSLGHMVRITGKTGARLVPISYETYVALKKVLPFGYTKYRFRRLISQAFANAHVKGSGISLRHSFGSLWEGDELVLQQIMGHAHLSTTKIYRAMRTERIFKQHNQFSPLKMILTRSRTLL